MVVCVHNVSDFIRDLHFRLCVVVPFCLISSVVLSQYDVNISNDGIVDFCQPIRYTLDLEKLFNTTFNDIVLELSFSEDIEYVSNNLDLVLKESSSRTIAFDYPDLRSCTFQRGEIIIQPKCYGAFTTLLTSITLKTQSDCLFESEERAVVKSPFIDTQFSDYTYDAVTNQLHKSISLFNAGSIDIEQFYILPTPNQQFATLETTSLGRIFGDTIFIENSSLGSQDSLSVDVVYVLQNCDLRSISYEIGFICSASSCVSTQEFIDDSEFYNNIVSTDVANRSSVNYGLCEPFGTEVVIRNFQGIQQTSIGDIYELTYLVSSGPRSRFGECLDAFAQIGDVQIRVNIQFSSEYLIEFQSITTDPDGEGGLDDLDGDGEFDDLALGDSLTFDLQFILKENCQENLHTLDIDFDTFLEFTNYCDQRLSRLNSSVNGGLTRSSDITDYFTGSIASIDALQIDQSNDRFILQDDTLLFIYTVRPSSNMTRICETNELELIVDVPSTVAWDNSVDILYYDANDTVVLTPQLLNETLMQLSFSELDSSRSSIQIQFIAVCDLNNTNYDSALSVCEQCVEYDLPRFRTQLSKPCVTDCDVSIPSWESISAPFYTRCESLPELIDQLVLGQIEYFNLTAGFIDQSESIKRDPFENHSSINNRFFFDNDTMLVKIPFAFECAEELSAFSIQLTENQLDFYEFNVFSSDVVLVNNTNNSEINRCSANLFINQNESAISFDFSETSFNLPCLDEAGKHILELKIIFTADCINTTRCGLSRSGTLQGITNVQLKNNCTRRVFYNPDTIYIHEVFREDFFRPTNFSSGQSLEIYDEFIVETVLYDGIVNDIEFEPEFRRKPHLRSINYTIPEGFEVTSDFLIVNNNILFLSENFLAFSDGFKIDTAVSVVPQEILNADGSRRYSFSDSDLKFYSDQLGDAIYAGLIIKSVCNPPIDAQEIIVDGVVEYVDYANGSLDTILYTFSQTRDLIFTPETFSTEDDFKIIDTLPTASWNINKTVDFFRFDNIISEGQRKTDEFKYYLKYESDQMKIDSVTTALLVDQPPFDDILRPISSQNTVIGDSIVEIEISSAFIIASDGDTLFNTRKPTLFVIHTSNHGCGLDSLFFEFGRKAEFFQDTCNREIYTDTLVSFSPPGFPQLEWTALPQEIKTIDDNQLDFRLSNIGQADLVENMIVFNHLPSANYSLFLIDPEGNAEDVSAAIQVNDSLILDLNLINDQLLPGLSALNVSSLDFSLVFSDVCVNDVLFNTTAKAISRSNCGDAVESPLLFSRSIPFIGEEDLKFELNLNSVTAEQCLDTASVRMVIQTNSSEQLENPELHLFIPKDMDSYSGTLKINGVSPDDPSSKLSDDKLNNTFIITDGIPASISDSLVVELKFDGSCIDVCRIDNISAFLLSSLDQQCVDGSVSSHLITRAYQTNKQVRWKPNISFTNSETRIIGSDEDRIRFELLGDIALTENPIYNGDISLTVFGDLNQNTIIDPTEIIVNQEIISTSKFEDQVYRIQDTVLIDPSIICALHVIVDVNQSCSCLFTSLPLSQSESYKTTRIIENCNPDSIAVKPLDIGNCAASLVSTNRVIDDIGGIVVFESDLSVPADTIRFLSNCQSCDFEDVIIIQNEKSEVDIILASDSDCSLTAQVLWNGDEDIPTDLSIEWNTTNEETNIIKNIPSGLLSVELTNESGCVYMDTVTISSTDVFMYDIILDDLNCTSDFPAIVDVVTQGVDPITIQWNDGVNAFQRLDIMPGSYTFTITDGNGCTITDTIQFMMPSDLSVQTIVNNTNCTNPRAGSIEVISDDQTLQYSITNESFSSQQLFDELSAGLYTIYIENNIGCIDSIQEQILLDTTFQLNIPIRLNAIFGDTINLNPEGLDNEQYVWQWESTDFNLSCFDCAQPVILLEKEGTVTLSVNNGFCSFDRLIRITADFSDLIYVPNAFSPNSDLNNDRFIVIPNNSFDQIDLAIFDRWGNKVYTVQNINVANNEIGWDGIFNGKEAEVGVYVYKAIVRRFVDDLEIELIGDFLLVN